MPSRRFAAAGRAALRAARKGSTYEDAHKAAWHVIVSNIEPRVGMDRRRVAAIVVTLRAIDGVARDAVEAALREDGVSDNYCIADARFAVIKNADRLAQNAMFSLGGGTAGAPRFLREFHFVRWAGWQGSQRFATWQEREEQVYIAACQAARQAIHDAAYPAAFRAARRVLSRRWRIRWRNTTAGMTPVGNFRQQRQTVGEIEETYFRQLIFGGLSIGDLVVGILSLVAGIVIVVAFVGLSVVANGFIDAASQGGGPEGLQIAANIIAMIMCIGVVVLAIRGIYRRLRRTRNG